MLVPVVVTVNVTGVKPVWATLVFVLATNVYRPFNLIPSVSKGIVEVVLAVAPVESNTAFEVCTVPPAVETVLVQLVAVMPVPDGVR